MTARLQPLRRSRSRSLVVRWGLSQGMAVDAGGDEARSYGDHARATQAGDEASPTAATYSLFDKRLLSPPRKLLAPPRRRNATVP